MSSRPVSLDDDPLMMINRTILEDEVATSVAGPFSRQVHVKHPLQTNSYTETLNDGRTGLLPSHQVNIDHSAQQENNSTTPEGGTSRRSAGIASRIPRTVEWRLHLGLLSKPHENAGRNKEVGQIEDTNALRLRFQRSRYDELEERHYWKNSPIGIAEASEDSSDREGLRHVSLGDDPLSALLNFDKSSDESKPKLFGGNIFGGAMQKRLGGRSDESKQAQSDCPADSDACKGSRWADFYSTKEVLDIIEKDLDRLPTDHYTIHHELKAKTNERDGFSNANRRISVSDNEVNLSQAAQAAAKSLSKSMSSENVRKKQNKPDLFASFSLRRAPILDEPDEPVDTGPDSKREKDSSIKARAAQLSRILFVYAREHPSIGYRQGMHEILSYILLALELDVLQQLNREERRSARYSKTNTHLTKGSSAGVDQSGKIVTIHLLDKVFLLHDAFSIFECIMTALAPAYDSMPSTSDEKIKGLLKEMQSDPDSSPMESMTNSIVSKIRYIARDEQLFGHILYMPVPPQLYFAKWIRLMFGREVDGGIKDVLILWDAFILMACANSTAKDSADKTHDVPVEISLLDVLKTSAAAMIILIRDKLLAPSIGYDGQPTGEPDPNVGIGYLMNYPPLQDIDPLIELVKSLMSKERKMSSSQLEQEEKEESQRHMIRQQRRTGDEQYLSPNHNLTPSTEIVCEDMNNNIDPLSVKAVTDLQNNRPRAQKRYTKSELADSIGHIAGGLMSFGAKAATATISTLQGLQHEPQNHQRLPSIDHPLRQDDGSDFLIQYRSQQSVPDCTAWEVENTENSKVVEDDRLQSKTSPDSIASDQAIQVRNVPFGDELKDSFASLGDPRLNLPPLDENDSIGFEDGSVTTQLSTVNQKSPRELAKILDKSIETLMSYFHDQINSDDVDSSPRENGSTGPTKDGLIPDRIWDALADVDSVKKDLLCHAALGPLEASTKSLKSSGGRRRFSTSS